MTLLLIVFFLVLYAGHIFGRPLSNSLKTNGHTALEPSDISHAENVRGPLPTISMPLHVQKNIQHQLYARSRSSGRCTQDTGKAHEDNSGVDDRHIYSRPSSGCGRDEVADKSATRRLPPAHRDQKDIYSRPYSGGH